MLVRADICVEVSVNETKCKKYEIKGTWMLFAKAVASHGGGEEDKTAVTNVQGLRN